LDQPGSARVARPADLDRDIDIQSSDLRADTTTRSDDVRNADSATIPVKEEQLTVGKRKGCSTGVIIGPGIARILVVVGRYDADEVDAGTHQLLNRGLSFPPAIKQTKNIRHNYFSSLCLSLGEPVSSSPIIWLSRQQWRSLLRPHG
jgi:hypothetical protein